MDSGRPGRSAKPKFILKCRAVSDAARNNGSEHSEQEYKMDPIIEESGTLTMDDVESGVEYEERERERRLAAALEYYALGLRPIPIEPNGKRPLVSWQQFQDRSPTEEEIRSWWLQWPEANVAIITGEASGIDVVDLDPGCNGWPGPDRELPDACVAKTPRGGRHVFFRHPPGVTSNAGQLAEHVDVRADGGYVLVSPSVVNGSPYTFINGTLADARQCEAPAWLKAELPKAISHTSSGGVLDERAAVEMTDGEVIPEGRRHSTLCSLAGTMRRKGVTEPDIFTELMAINSTRCRPPSPEEEIRQIAQYIGQKEPGPGVDNGQEGEPGCYFEGESFVVARLARAINGAGTYAFGRDPDSGAGRLMRYDKGVWRPAIDVEIEARGRLQDRTSPNRIKNTFLTLEKDVEQVPWSEWNKKRRLINCHSGMLNPMTMELHPHDPKCLSTMQIPMRWDPNADTEPLRCWLSEMLPPDCVELVQQLMGYLLIADVSIKKLFILEGPSDTGKTTLLTIIQNLIGSQNFEIIELHDLSDNRFAAAGLENKLVGLYDDLQSGRLKDVSVIKMLTGGSEWLRVERKGVDAYKAPLYATLIYAANEVPTAQDKSDAWLNRCLIVPMHNAISEDRKDGDLKTKLSTGRNLQGAFRFAVEGLSRLLHNKMKLPEPETIKAAAKKYEMDNDTVAAFVEQGCVRGDPSELHVPKTVWYSTYEKWCGAMGYKFTTGKKKAYDRLRNIAGIIEGTVGNDRTRVFRGIEIADDAWAEIEQHKHAREHNRR